VRFQVVFLADVPPKYMAGEIRAVSGGFARNYLIPQGLAAPATSEQMKRIEKIKKVAEEKRFKESSDLKGVADKLEGLSITLKGRAGEGGHLYGSITNMAIAEALTEAVGQDIDRRTITLPEPIRDLGTFEVPVRLHMDLVPTVSVIVEDAAGRYVAVVPEEATDEDDDDDEAVDNAGEESADAEEADAEEVDEDEEDA
jgi:large subunit ribosomal protein L9|tara:strand:+ start:1002 stop:1598 length:597 start_codon:yes stop_codon:yes gene_type:complete